MTNKDVGANIFFVLFGAIVLLVIPSQIRILSDSDLMGPRFFPYLVAAAVLGINLVMLFYNLCRRKKESHNKQRPARPTSSVVSIVKDEWRVIAVFLVLLLTVQIMSWLGYVVAGIFAFSAILFILSARKWYYYAIGIGVVWLFYTVFSKILYVAFP